MREFVLVASNTSVQSPEFEGIVEAIFISVVSAGVVQIEMLDGAGQLAFKEDTPTSSITVIPRHITTDYAGNEDDTPGDVNTIPWFHVGRITLGSADPGTTTARILVSET